MQNKKTLIVRTYPALIESFAKENLNLKTLCGFLIALSFISVVTTACLIRKGPVVVALGENGEQVQVETKITDLQIIAAAKEYLSYRYNWSFENVSEQLKKAELFVQPSLANAFEKSMLNVEKFVREKKVTQRVYAKAGTVVDVKNQTVTIHADRITDFESLKAATEMSLVLSFTTGSRSVVNPWGIYITKEVEGGSQ